MKVSKLAPALTAAAMLVACEARIGNDAPPVDENATAAGRAEEGRFTIEAPGFNMSIDIPEGIRARADVEDHRGLVYPGSTFSGMHVQGGREGSEGDGEVEMRFTTGDAPGQVAAWYRDPARGEEFSVQAAQQEGDVFIVSGTGRRDPDRFTVRASPREGGGTELRLLLSDSG